MAISEISINSEWLFEASDLKETLETMLPLTGKGDPNGVVDADFLGQLYVSDTGVPYICTAMAVGETPAVWGEIALVGA